MRIFRYKRSATNLRVGLILLWMGLVVIPVAFSYYPFNKQDELDTMLLLILYSLLPIIYCFYLVQVAQTAVLTVDDRSIGYHDKYTRLVARWDEIAELTHVSVRLQNGKAIFIKLGVPALENWREFEKMVVEKANLTPARQRGNHIHRWTRAVEPLATEGLPCTGSS